MPTPEPRPTPPKALLRVPASPPPGFESGLMRYGIGVLRQAELPRDGWQGGDPHVDCEVWVGQLLMATWTVHGEAAEWPTNLPEVVSCSNGALVVPFRVGFGPGAQEAWPTADGRMIVPHNGVDAIDVEWPVPEGLAAAEPVVRDRGFDCAVGARGGLRVHLGGNVPEGSSLCRVTLADGTLRTDEVVVLRYSEG